MIKGFNDKMANDKNAWEESSSEMNGESDIKALMIAGDKKLHEYVNTRFPKTRSVSGRGARIYKSTFCDGIKAGKTITLHKPVTSEDGYLGNILT